MHILTPAHLHQLNMIHGNRGVSSGGAGGVASTEDMSTEQAQPDPSTPTKVLSSLLFFFMSSFFSWKDVYFCFYASYIYVCIYIYIHVYSCMHLFMYLSI